MPSAERKTIGKKQFYYLSEQLRVGKKYKKIQVYLGKSIPKKLNEYYEELKVKEIELISTNISDIFHVDAIFDASEITKIEKLRIEWKYKQLCMTKLQKERFWRKFAIQFIFESNAIEGSRLSEKEVSSIVRKKNIKKSIYRREIQEVLNSLKVFQYLEGDEFTLN